MEFLLPLLGGAVGAAVIYGLFAYLKTRQDRRVEHEQWLRGQQLTAYADLDRLCKGGRLCVASAYRIEDWKSPT